MTFFIIGLMVFFGAHSFTAFFRNARQGVVDKIGAGGYRGVYSLFALAGLVFIILGWPNADTAPIYIPPYWLKHIAYVLILLAFILLAAAYAPKGKIAAAARHPMLAGLKLWALAHLLVNGEVRSVLLFGAFLAFGIADRIAVKRRGAPVPAVGPWRHDVISIGVGAAAYGAMAFYLHPMITGVSVF